jgi:hypothetical protein
VVIFPILVVVLNGFFSIQVLRQFLRRGRSYQLVWTCALVLGFLAAFFYLLFLADSTSPVYFRLYYIFGGLLMAAYLGLGSVYLHLPRRAADTIAVIVVIASVVGATLIFQAHVDVSRLHSSARSIGPGTNALGPGAWKALVAILNSFGALAVITGAVYSAGRTFTRHAPVRFLWANILIAGGTLIAGAAGIVADQGVFAGSFWAVLLVGFIVLFAGFLLASGIRSTQRPGKDVAKTSVAGAVTAG